MRGLHCHQVGDDFIEGQTCGFNALSLELNGAKPEIVRDAIGLLADNVCEFTQIMVKLEAQPDDALIQVGENVIEDLFAAVACLTGNGFQDSILHAFAVLVLARSISREHGVTDGDGNAIG
jgi:hypothetical protein